jgi:hypothetical protein
MGSGVRVIERQQIAVANGVGTIGRLTLAMTIAGVAGYTRVAHPGWSKSLAGLLFEGVQVFEEVFTRVEVFLHAGYVPHGRSGS